MKSANRVIYLSVICSILFFCGHVIAQSKKMQIEALNTRVDSVKILIASLRESSRIIVQDNEKKIQLLKDSFEEQKVNRGNLDTQIKEKDIQINLRKKNLRNKLDSVGLMAEELYRNLRTEYREILIGDQVWMAENLNTDRFRNGDPIPEAKTKEEWKKARESKQPAWCYFDNDATKGVKYGKLYNWYAVNDPRGLAPSGWKVPTDQEWTQLLNTIGSNPGKKLKSKSGWHENGNGTDTYSFVGLPGGFRYSEGAFDLPGNDAYWWSASELGADEAAWYRYLFFSADSMGRDLNDKRCGYSVRCLRDATNTNDKIEKKEDVHLVSDEDTMRVRDGNFYHTIIIGRQEWMAENLNVSTFRNGDPIPQAKTNAEWFEAGEAKQPAWCYYENSSSNGNKFGKLYNWYAVNDARGLAPSGWKVPTDQEWTQLLNAIGSNQGKKLKSKSGWFENGHGTDAYGFVALPGGCRSSNGTFNSLGGGAFWWSASEDYAGDAWCRYLYYGNNGSVGRNSDSEKYGFSVRCLRD
jgi:uncharacterized protein (TIGR02145 family)